MFFVIFLHFFHFWKHFKNTRTLSFELIFFVVLFEHSKDNPTNFQVIWSLFEYTCSYTLCYANITRINVFWCMTRGNPSELRPIDPEIDRTFHRGRKHLRNLSLHAEYSVIFPDSSDLSILIFILITWLNLLHLMRGPWVSSLHQSSLMTVYAFNTLRRKFHVLKTRLIHLLPKFHGLAGEDPWKNLK